jgi:hypothetical protein
MTASNTGLGGGIKSARSCTGSLWTWSKSLPWTPMIYTMEFSVAQLPLCLHDPECWRNQGWCALYCLWHWIQHSGADVL